MQIEKIAFPLTVAAAIIALWATLRRAAPIVQSTIANPPFLFPQLASVPQILYAPFGVPAGATVPAAGTAAGTDPAYLSAARADPLQAGQPAPGYTSYNVPPGLQMMAPSVSRPAAHAAGGCGGCSGCSGGAGKDTGCAGRSNAGTAVFADGGGNCMQLTRGQAAEKSAGAGLNMAVAIRGFMDSLNIPIAAYAQGGAYAVPNLVTGVKYDRPHN